MPRTTLGLKIPLYLASKVVRGEGRIVLEKAILIVDDSPTIRSSIRKALEDVHLFTHILEADDGVKALEVFLKNRVDFIITDVVMPKVDGYKLVSSIKGMEKGKDIPVIMLTERRESTDKIKGLTIGASDYIIKPFDSGELIARVKVLLRMEKLQEELKEKNALLERLAITDELTGVPNRRYFFEILRMQMALAKRYGFPIACLLMDIDHFKRVNDTYGHPTGDMVLKRLAQVISSTKREGELLARIGGEEFAICLFKTDALGAIHAAERIRRLVESTDFPEGFKVTVSIGVSSFPEDGVETIDDLLKTADEAMYHAKKAGRNRVVVYSEIIN